MLRHLNDGEEEKDVKIKSLHASRKTYLEELEEKFGNPMKSRHIAQKNPFANLTDFDLSEKDCELMRERAKIYMARREWDRALMNLNRTLCQWGATEPEQYDENYPPNRQVQYLIVHFPQIEF